MEYFLFSVLIISVIGYSIYLITKKKENTDAKVSDANNSIKFEAIKNSSNEHENKSDFKESFSFKGKGTKNPTLINVYNELQKRLDIWRERYSEFEYPNRIVINMIYQSLQLEVIWNNLNDFTSKPFYQDYNQATSFVENEKNKYNSIVQKEVERKYEQGGLIGNLNIDVYKELVAKAQKGDIVALEKITEGFLWYSGAFELGVVYCSLLKNGTTQQFALNEICEIQTGINMNNLSEVQALFGNNISLLFKVHSDITPEVQDHNLIRFKKGNIKHVEYRFEGIWLKSYKVKEIDGNIYHEFEHAPEFASLVSTKKPIGIDKETIDYHYEKSVRNSFQVDDYQYPYFPDEKINRLHKYRIIQITHLVNLFMNMFQVVRELLIQENENSTEKALILVLDQLYNKDSDFDRVEFYNKTKFYLYPIDDNFIGLLIQSSIEKFNLLKKTNNGVFKPTGNRDEEEKILAFIDTVLIREFLLGKFMNKIELKCYFDLVPDLVEELYKELIIHPKDDKDNSKNRDLLL